MPKQVEGGEGAAEEERVLICLQCVPLEVEVEEAVEAVEGEAASSKFEQCITEFYPRKTYRFILWLWLRLRFGHRLRFGLTSSLFFRAPSGVLDCLPRRDVTSRGSRRGRRRCRSRLR